MKKAITPIISTILLLLITIALVSLAASYLFGYWESRISKMIDITGEPDCIDGKTAIIIQNIGTSWLNKSDMTIMNKQDGRLVDSWSLKSLNGSYMDIIQPRSEYAKIEATCCGEVGVPDCPQTCSYNILVGGSTQNAIVYCTE
jgi:flagellin-like protein